MEDWERRIEQNLDDAFNLLRNSPLSNNLRHEIRLMDESLRRLKNSHHEVDLLEKWWALPTREEDVKC